MARCNRSKLTKRHFATHDIGLPTAIFKDRRTKRERMKRPAAFHPAVERLWLGVKSAPPGILR
jgi:hypothetical protein